VAHTFYKTNQNSSTLKKKGGTKLTRTQTNIGDLKKHLEDLQSITNANISRLQKHLDIVSSAKFTELPYKEQYEHLEAVAEIFNIHYFTRFNWQEKSRLSKLADVEHALANKTPAKNIPFDIFKAIINDEGISVEERNKLIRDRGDKRFKELP
jgi:hypothetical protein